MVDITKKLEKMEAEIEHLRKIEWVRSKLLNDMKWDCMNVSDETDENGDRVYVAPEKDEYMYTQYQAYLEIIDLIDKTYFK